MKYSKVCSFALILALGLPLMGLAQTPDDAVSGPRQRPEDFVAPRGPFKTIDNVLPPRTATNSLPVATRTRETLRERLLARPGLQTMSDHVVLRLKNASERLTDIADRIGSRITKIEESLGVDLGTAQAHLDEAYVHIDTVDEKVTALADYLDTVFNGDSDVEPSEIFSTMRNLIDDVRQAIQDVHTSLRDAVVEIKAVVESNSDTTDAE